MGGLPAESSSTGLGQLAAGLASKGIAIGTAGAMIAAQAIQRGLVIVSNNTGHFRCIRGLATENWV